MDRDVETIDLAKYGKFNKLCNIINETIGQFVVTHYQSNTTS